MLATELALKNIPVRVNSIAPGVYESEMTFDTISGREEVAKVAQSLLPVPAGRPGTYVYPPLCRSLRPSDPNSQGLARLLVQLSIYRPLRGAIPMAKRLS